ncbi:MAG TPA: peptidoglycan DD-metalloendopeptidase family protein [Candidatus Paceibacterota bacterium]|nr:peptidoglycan DD-metalloendopeptidase family protein [Candidatus Paceibacterota bacterium]
MFLLNKKRDVWFFSILLLCAGFSFMAVRALAENASPSESRSEIDTLKNEIETRNNEIKKLEEEIALLDKSIEKTQGQAKSLKNELSVINNTISQLNKQVKVTETKIQSTELNIQKLSIEIKDKEKNITEDKTSVGEMIQTMQQIDLTSPIEVVLSGDNFSDAWVEVDYLERVQKSVNERINDLEIKKKSLEENKTELAAEKASLNSLRSRLLDQKNIANQGKKNKNSLLAETQNQEANYKKLLASTKAKKDNLERELFNYEAQLKVAIDPNSYPKAGTSVLAWPVNPPYITQKFGKTSDSGRLYASGTHNGVDFRAKTGTPLVATAPGTVVGIGDTDIACKGVSYGKWVLIRHTNGLATLYGHLSLIKAYAGEELQTGDIIGYSGNTGYSEGPHLHFGLFVANAVRITGPTEYKSKVCGTYLRMPIAPTNAYLDPLAYLPITGSNIKTD